MEKEPRKETAMRYLMSTIQINASQPRVWKILTDFDGYPLWNPFIVHAQGQARKGHYVNLRLLPPGEPTQAYTAEIAALDWGRKLCLKGGRFFSFRAQIREYLFAIKSIRGGRAVRFSQKLSLGGLELPFVWLRIQLAFSHGMESMNRCLKQRAEPLPEIKPLADQTAEAPPVPPAAGKQLSPPRQ